MFNWDLSNLSDGPITLHLYVTGKAGYAEQFVHFSLALPTPTPPPTETPAPTETPIPTDTPVPTDTPPAPTETATP